MPTYREVAQYRIVAGERIAQFPVSLNILDTSGLRFWVLDDATGRQVRTAMLTPNQILNFFPDAAARKKAHPDEPFGAYITLPDTFLFDGQGVDASNEIAALPATGNYYVDIVGLTGENEGADVTFRLTLDNVDGAQEATTDESVLALTEYEDNRPGNRGRVGGYNDALSSYHVALWLEKNGQYNQILPEVNAFAAVDFWCDISSIGSEFSGLALTAREDIESVSTRNLSLITSYHPRYEDHDLSVVFGVDENNIPVVYQLQSTDRTERGDEIILNLAASVV